MTPSRHKPPHRAPLEDVHIESGLPASVHQGPYAWQGFCNPVGKRYPEGRYLGGKNLVWFACVGHGRAGRLFLDDGTPFGVSLLFEPLRTRVR